MASYEQSKSSKLWSVRFREIDSSGSVHNKRLSGYRTKKEAQYAYEDYCVEKKNFSPEPQETAIEYTFDELFLLYSDFKKTRIKESSFYELNMHFRAKILPYFTGRKILGIKPADIIEFQKTIIDYSYKYQKGIITHLASFYKFCNRYYDIPNIMEKVERPRNLEAKKEMLCWSPDEFNAFISKVSSAEYNMLFRLLYITGCRRGEALALTWNDIDLDAGIIKINKSVSFQSRENGTRYKITTPKNSTSNRNVSIPDFFCKQLESYKETVKTQSSQFVFGGSDPLPATTIARIMDKASAEAGVKRIRVHDLRHSCASHLIHKGISIVAVSRRLGHSNIEQTLNTYSHMMPDDQRMILQALNDLSDKLDTIAPTN